MSYVIILVFPPLFHPFLSHWRQTPYFSITNTTLSALREPESLRYITKSRPGSLRTVPETLSAQLLALFPFSHSNDTRVVKDILLPINLALLIIRRHAAFVDVGPTAQQTIVVPKANAWKSEDEL